MKDERNTQRRRRRRNSSVRQSVAGPSSWSPSSGLIRLQYFSDRMQQILRILSAFCAAVKKYCRLLSLCIRLHMHLPSHSSLVDFWYDFCFCIIFFVLPRKFNLKCWTRRRAQKIHILKTQEIKTKRNRHSWRFFFLFRIRYEIACFSPARPFFILLHVCLSMLWLRFIL